MAQKENNQGFTKRPSLEEMGGEEGIWRWVECFYDKLVLDPRVSALFQRDLSLSKQKQYAYFVEFFGGEPRYTQRYGQAFLRYKHRKAKIGIAEHDAWMEINMAAMLEVGMDEAVAKRVERILAPIAKEMINHHPDKKDSYYFNA